MSAELDRTVAAFSRLGEHGLIWHAIAAAGALAKPGRRGEFGRASGTVLLAYAANQAIKFTVRRRRPPEKLTGTMSNYSYPSAHAATSAAGARALSGLIPAGPLGLLAAALAVSRIYLRVHFPGDVVAGAALGAAIAELRR